MVPPIDPPAVWSDYTAMGSEWVAVILLVLMGVLMGFGYSLKNALFIFASGLVSILFGIYLLIYKFPYVTQNFILETIGVVMIGIGLIFMYDAVGIWLRGN